MSLRCAIFLLVGACLGLTGCEQKYTESYYFSHPDRLKSVLQQCQMSGGTPETFDTRCKLAYNTAVRMTRLMQAFVSNQTEFGQRIMRAQIHVAELSQQWQIAKKARLPTASLLKKRLVNAQKNVDNLRAIVGIFVQM
jgi:hypothetical protein